MRRCAGRPLRTRVCAIGPDRRRARRDRRRATWCRRCPAWRSGIARDRDQRAGRLSLRGRPCRAGCADVFSGQLRRRAAGGQRAILRRSTRRYGDAPRPRRGSHGHWGLDVHQPRRCPRSGTQHRWYRAVRQPGCSHRPTAPCPADSQTRRSTRDGAGRRHQPAQRRGQSEPVLPARVQPGSRHRFRHRRGRDAGEHADAWTWSRLLRSEIS